MKLENLHSTISVLQEKLNAYSFDELSTEEACLLQDSLNNFKNLLELSTSKQYLFIGDTKEPDFNKELKNVNPKGLFKQTFLHNLGGEDQLLVAKASNEIKTPLNGILGFVDKLLESDLNESQINLVKAIQDTSYTMLEVSQDILEYSKLGAGLEKNENIPIKFYSAIRDVLFLCNTLILNKDLKLEVELDPNIPKNLLGDPSKLSQILLNLLGSAIQNTKEGEILLKVIIKEEYQDNLLLEFEVCDTSEGIEDTSLKNVFDLYKQKDELNSGLGLSMVKQMVETLGGEIYVSSRMGVGTVFTFTVPFKVTKKKLMELEKISIKGMQILIFEDNKLNQKIIDYKLQKWKCKTFITDDFEKGMKILKNNTIDIILMDLRMPNKNGDEIANHIRNHNDKRLQNIPIIAITADYDIKNNIEFNTNDFNDFLLKPYSSDELYKKLVQQQSLKKKNMETIPSNHINEQGGISKIDLTPVLSECMGDVDLLEELIKLFKNNSLEFIGKAIVHIKNEDYESLKFCTHKIKAGLKMMKTDALLNNVLQIENVIKEEVDVKHLNFLYKCFIEDYPIVEEQLDLEIKRLKEER